VHFARWYRAAGAYPKGMYAIEPHVHSTQTTLADEGGVGFWFPGLFGSLAAVPQVPGWALGIGTRDRQLIQPCQRQRECRLNAEACVILLR